MSCERSDWETTVNDLLMGPSFWISAPLHPSQLHRVAVGASIIVSVFIPGYKLKKESKTALKKVDLSLFFPPKKYQLTPQNKLFNRNEQLKMGHGLHESALRANWGHRPATVRNFCTTMFFWVSLAQPASLEATPSIKNILAKMLIIHQNLQELIK